MNSTPDAQPSAADTGREPPAGSPGKPFHYWQRFQSKAEAGPARLPDGEDLAALRRGAGREPGAEPALWPYYTELLERGDWITDGLRAEHHTLVLFGFHQQSQQEPVNVQGPSVGAAVRRLQERDRYSQEALERRFTAAATTDSVDELAVLLRGLVTQFRGERVGLDYEALFRDLVRWQRPESRDRARRRWGADYFRFEPKAEK